MTVELARGWVEKGYKATVLTLAPAELDFFELDPRVGRLELAFTADPARGLVESLGANFARARAIRNVLRKVQPDIAVGMMSTSAVLLAMAAVGLRIRTFGSERTYPPMIPLGAAKERMRWFTYGLLDGVVGQTEAAGRWLRENTRARQVHVIPNHIDLPLIRQSPIVSPETVMAADRRCVLGVGRMSEEKQFDRMISAFVSVSSRFPQWDLVIAGDGPDRPQIEAQIAQAGLGSRIHLIGSTGNIGDWYERADLFLMTSRFEGFPNALMEAMAHGVPPIAFDCMTGPAELIYDSENGLLIPLNNMPALVEGVSKLMGDENLRNQLATGARSTRERFSRRRVMELWAEAFGGFGGGGHDF